MDAGFSRDGWQPEGHDFCRTYHNFKLSIKDKKRIKENLHAVAFNIRWA